MKKTASKLIKMFIKDIIQDKQSKFVFIFNFRVLVFMVQILNMLLVDLMKE